MAYIVMAYIVMACIVMAYIVMACIVMACIVMACIVMAYSYVGLGDRLRLGAGYTNSLAQSSGQMSDAHSSRAAPPTAARYHVGY